MLTFLVGILGSRFHLPLPGKGTSQGLRFSPRHFLGIGICHFGDDSSLRIVSSNGLVESPNRKIHQLLSSPKTWEMKVAFPFWSSLDLFSGRFRGCLKQSLVGRFTMIGHSYLTCEWGYMICYTYQNLKFEGLDIPPVSFNGWFGWPIFPHGENNLGGSRSARNAPPFGTNAPKKESHTAVAQLGPLKPGALWCFCYPPRKKKKKTHTHTHQMEDVVRTNHCFHFPIFLVLEFFSPPKTTDWVVATQIFFMFTPIRGRLPFWLIFFKWVGSTTN